jgi:spore coat protein CotF
MIKDAKIREILQTHTIKIQNHQVTIENIYIIHAAAPQKLVLRCDVVSDSPLNTEERKRLKKDILAEISPYVREKHIVLEALERYRY